MTPGARKTTAHRRRYTVSTDGRQSSTARSSGPHEREPRRIELELRVPAPPVGVPVGGPGGRGQRAIERVPEPEELSRVIVEGRDTSPEGRVGERAAVEKEQEQRRLAPQGPHGGIVLSTPTETGVSRLGRLRSLGSATLAAVIPPRPLRWRAPPADDRLQCWRGQPQSGSGDHLAQDRLVDGHVEAVDEPTGLRGHGSELLQPAGLAELGDLVGRRVVRRARSRATSHDCFRAGRSERRAGLRRSGG